MPLAPVFKALADPTRRAILRALRDGPLSAGALAERFPLARSTLSQHLGVLLEAGLVEVERDGRRRIYRLSTSVLEDVLAFLIELRGGRNDEEEPLSGSGTGA